MEQKFSAQAVVQDRVRKRAKLGMGGDWTVSRSHFFRMLGWGMLANTYFVTVPLPGEGPKLIYSDLSSFCMPLCRFVLLLHLTTAPTNLGQECPGPI